LAAFARSLSWGGQVSSKATLGQSRDTRTARGLSVFVVQQSATRFDDHPVAVSVPARNR